MVLTICFFIVIIIAILLNLPLRVFFSFNREESENKTEIFIKYLFVKKRIKKKQTEYKEEKEHEEKPDKGIRYYKRIYKLVKKDVKKLISYFLKKAIVFENINFKTYFGYSNAATTGIMTGVQNAFAYSVMAFFHNNFHVKDFSISVNPDFNNERFCVNFSCILKIKTVHIIIVIIKGIRILRIIKKEENKERKKK